MDAARPLLPLLTVLALGCVLVASDPITTNYQFNITEDDIAVATGIDQWIAYGDGSVGTYPKSGELDKDDWRYCHYKDKSIIPAENECGFQYIRSGGLNSVGMFILKTPINATKVLQVTALKGEFHFLWGFNPVLDTEQEDWKPTLTFSLVPAVDSSTLDGFFLGTVVPQPMASSSWDIANVRSAYSQQEFAFPVRETALLSSKANMYLKVTIKNTGRHNIHFFPEDLVYLRTTASSLSNTMTIEKNDVQVNWGWHTNDATSINPAISVSDNVYVSTVSLGNPESTTNGFLSQAVVMPESGLSIKSVSLRTRMIVNGDKVPTKNPTFTLVLRSALSSSSSSQKLLEWTPELANLTTTGGCESDSFDCYSAVDLLAAPVANGAVIPRSMSYLQIVVANGDVKLQMMGNPTIVFHTSAQEVDTTIPSMANDVRFQTSQLSDWSHHACDVLHIIGVDDDESEFASWLWCRTNPRASTKVTDPDQCDFDVIATGWITNNDAKLVTTFNLTAPANNLGITELVVLMRVLNGHGRPDGSTPMPRLTFYLSDANDAEATYPLGSWVPAPYYYDDAHAKKDFVPQLITLKVDGKTRVLPSQVHLHVDIANNGYHNIVIYPEATFVLRTTPVDVPDGVDVDQDIIMMTGKETWHVDNGLSSSKATQIHMPAKGLVEYDQLRCTAQTGEPAEKDCDFFALRVPGESMAMRFPLKQSLPVDPDRVVTKAIVRISYIAQPPRPGVTPTLRLGVATTRVESKNVVWFTEPGSLTVIDKGKCNAMNCFTAFTFTFTLPKSSVQQLIVRKYVWLELQGIMMTMLTDPLIVFKSQPLSDFPNLSEGDVKVSMADFFANLVSPTASGSHISKWHINRCGDPAPAVTTDCEFDVIRSGNQRGVESALSTFEIPAQANRGINKLLVMLYINHGYDRFAGKDQALPVVSFEMLDGLEVGSNSVKVASFTPRAIPDCHYSVGVQRGNFCPQLETIMIPTPIPLWTKHYLRITIANTGLNMHILSDSGYISFQSFAMAQPATYDPSTDILLATGLDSWQLAGMNTLYMKGIDESGTDCRVRQGTAEVEGDCGFEAFQTAYKDHSPSIFLKAPIGKPGFNLRSIFVSTQMNWGYDPVQPGNLNVPTWTFSLATKPDLNAQAMQAGPEWAPTPDEDYHWGTCNAKSCYKEETTSLSVNSVSLEAPQYLKITVANKGVHNLHFLPPLIVLKLETVPSFPITCSDPLGLCFSPTVKGDYTFNDNIYVPHIRSADDTTNDWRKCLTYAGTVAPADQCDFDCIATGSRNNIGTIRIKQGVTIPAGKRVETVSFSFRVLFGHDKPSPQTTKPIISFELVDEYELATYPMISWTPEAKTWWDEGRSKTSFVFQNKSIAVLGSEYTEIPFTNGFLKMSVKNGPNHNVNFMTDMTFVVHLGDVKIPPGVGSTDILLQTGQGMWSSAGGYGGSRAYEFYTPPAGAVIEGNLYCWKTDAENNRVKASMGDGCPGFYSIHSGDLDLNVNPRTIPLKNALPTAPLKAVTGVHISFSYLLGGSEPTRDTEKPSIRIGISQSRSGTGAVQWFKGSISANAYNDKSIWFENCNTRSCYRQVAGNGYDLSGFDSVPGVVLAGKKYLVLEITNTKDHYILMRTDMIIALKWVDPSTIPALKGDIPLEMTSISGSWQFIGAGAYVMHTPAVGESKPFTCRESDSQASEDATQCDFDALRTGDPNSEATIINTLPIAAKPGYGVGAVLLDLFILHGGSACHPSTLSDSTIKISLVDSLEVNANEFPLATWRPRCLSNWGQGNYKASYVRHMDTIELPGAMPLWKTTYLKLWFDNANHNLHILRNEGTISFRSTPMDTFGYKESTDFFLVPSMKWWQLSSQVTKQTIKGSSCRAPGNVEGADSDCNFEAIRAGGLGQTVTTFITKAMPDNPGYALESLTVSFSLLWGGNSIEPGTDDIPMFTFALSDSPDISAKFDEIGTWKPTPRTDAYWGTCTIKECFRNVRSPVLKPERPISLETAKYLRIKVDESLTHNNVYFLPSPLIVYRVTEGGTYEASPNDIHFKFTRDNWVLTSSMTEMYILPAGDTSNWKQCKNGGKLIAADDPLASKCGFYCTRSGSKNGEAVGYTNNEIRKPGASITEVHFRINVNYGYDRPSADSDKPAMTFSLVDETSHVANEWVLGSYALHPTLAAWWDTCNHMGCFKLVVGAFVVEGDPVVLPDKPLYLQWKVTNGRNHNLQWLMDTAEIYLTAPILPFDAPDPKEGDIVVPTGLGKWLLKKGVNGEESSDFYTAPLGEQSFELGQMCFNEMKKDGPEAAHCNFHSIRTGNSGRVSAFFLKSNVGGIQKDSAGNSRSLQSVEVIMRMLFGYAEPSSKTEDPVMRMSVCDDLEGNNPIELGEWTLDAADFAAAKAYYGYGNDKSVYMKQHHVFKPTIPDGEEVVSLLNDRFLRFQVFNGKDHNVHIMMNASVVVHTDTYKVTFDPLPDDLVITTGDGTWKINDGVNDGATDFLIPPLGEARYGWLKCFDTIKKELQAEDCDFRSLRSGKKGEEVFVNLRKPVIVGTDDADQKKYGGRVIDKIRVRMEALLGYAQPTTSTKPVRITLSLADSLEINANVWPIGTLNVKTRYGWDTGNIRSRFEELYFKHDVSGTSVSIIKGVTYYLRLTIDNGPDHNIQFLEDPTILLHTIVDPHAIEVGPLDILVHTSKNVWTGTFSNHYVPLAGIVNGWLSCNSGYDKENEKNILENRNSECDYNLMRSGGLNNKARLYVSNPISDRDDRVITGAKIQIRALLGYGHRPEDFPASEADTEPKLQLTLQTSLDDGDNPTVYSLGVFAPKNIPAFNDGNSRSSCKRNPEGAPFEITAPSEIPMNYPLYFKLTVLDTAKHNFMMMYDPFIALTTKAVEPIKFEPDADDITIKAPEWVAEAQKMTSSVTDILLTVDGGGNLKCVLDPSMVDPDVATECNGHFLRFGDKGGSPEVFSSLAIPLPLETGKVVSEVFVSIDTLYGFERPTPKTTPVELEFSLSTSNDGKGSEYPLGTWRPRMRSWWHDCNARSCFRNVRTFLNMPATVPLPEAGSGSKLFLKIKSINGPNHNIHILIDTLLIGLRVGALELPGGLVVGPTDILVQAGRSMWTAQAGVSNSEITEINIPPPGIDSDLGTWATCEAEDQALGPNGEILVTQASCNFYMLRCGNYKGSPSTFVKAPIGQRSWLGVTGLSAVIDANLGFAEPSDDTQKPDIIFALTKDVNDRGMRDEILFDQYTVKKTTYGWRTCHSRSCFDEQRIDVNTKAGVPIPLATPLYLRMTVRNNRDHNLNLLSNVTVVLHTTQINNQTGPESTGGERPADLLSIQWAMVLDMNSTQFSEQALISNANRDLFLMMGSAFNYTYSQSLRQGGSDANRRFFVDFTVVVTSTDRAKLNDAAVRLYRSARVGKTFASYAVLSVNGQCWPGGIVQANPVCLPAESSDSNAGLAAGVSIAGIVVVVAVIGAAYYVYTHNMCRSKAGTGGQKSTPRAFAASTNSTAIAVEMQTGGVTGPASPSTTGIYSAMAPPLPATPAQPASMYASQPTTATASMYSTQPSTNIPRL